MTYSDHVHYTTLYRNLTPRFAWRDDFPGGIPAWREGLGAALQQALGLDVLAADLAGHRPQAERLAVEPCDGFVREHWRILVEPTVPLPFYLLRPDPCPSVPMPLVITPHGHGQPHVYAGLVANEDERRKTQEGQRDIAVQAVREGYLAIAPTTRAFGATRTAADIADDRLSSCRTALMHGLLVGRTPIGERVWDMRCLLDWALAELPVDTRRIAITGNSGGGTVSLFTAACDARFTVAAPGSYFSTFADSIGSIRHCDCNYVPGIMRLGEMADIAGLIAPRPFLAINGIADEIFPIAAARAAAAHLRRIYAAHGASGACALYEGDGGHRYYSAGAWPFIRAAFAA